MTEKLFFHISDDITGLPKVTQNLKYLNIRVVEAYEPPKNDCVYGHFYSYEFIMNHLNEITGDCGAGMNSILVWNPEKQPITYKNLESLIFYEIYDIHDDSNTIRLIRNLLQIQFLEYRITQKTDINTKLLDIGTALSAEKDNEKLLDLILQKTREITKADAGSIFLIERNHEGEIKSLLFKIAHTDSNSTDFTEFRMPLNTKSVAGWVSVSGEIVNIVDVYDISPELEYSFNNNYDKATGYRSRSMLSVPMTSHTDERIGVIQLINKKRDFGVKLTDTASVDEYVETFSSEDESVVLSLASQAAISLENNRLYEEIETLFEGFVRASVKAIESRDPTTSGHSHRVADYTVELAKHVDASNSPKLQRYSFSREQIKEIRYASLLHDFGKVGVREHVLVKAKKLYGSQLERIELRFNLIRQSILLDSQRRMFKEYTQDLADRDANIAAIMQEEKNKLAKLDNYYAAILEANEPRVLAEEPEKILEQVSREFYLDDKGTQYPYLKENELQLLRIKRGSLDENERQEIESHVIHSFEFLSKIPWTSQMKNIPNIARWHHEKLDGSGYPDSRTDKRIPIQSKMMAVSDIFDALTARDRPYKLAVPTERALDILKAEVESNHIDPDLVKIFIDAKIYTKADENGA